MAIQRAQKKAGKSESLTIRLDPKMRFALEFVARLNGQTITKVIERAVTDAADRTKVDNGGNDYDAPNWRTYWDVSDGIRAIKLASDENTHPTFEEEEMLDFIRQHWRFFSIDARLNTLKRDNIEVLWPMMPSFLEWWRNHKSSDRFYVAKMMNHTLAEAGLDTIPERSSESPD